MIITTEIFLAYSTCPRKAYLLAYSQEAGTPHPYSHIIEQEKAKNRERYIERLQRRQKHKSIADYHEQFFQSGKDFLLHAHLETMHFRAFCGILERTDTDSKLGNHRYAPVLFTGTWHVMKSHRLELHFVAYVLSQCHHAMPKSGRIIPCEDESIKVRFSKMDSILVSIIAPLQEWQKNPPSEPPPIILMKECLLCQFYQACKEQAKDEDNLSLLDKLSTPKSIQQYEKKGIFTVHQLSYLFRPRRPKKQAVKASPPHKPEIQALALRTGKTYIQQLPEFTRYPIELFLDIEGTSDPQVYYLIGVVVKQNEHCTYHALWAASRDDEKEIWYAFVSMISQYSGAPIYHYGNYEKVAMTTLGQRYETNCSEIISRLVNINTFIYGKIYFPVYSNGLKEIGKYIGASWSSPDASGLQSLVWRHYWEETYAETYKELLLTYNKEDCDALKRLTDELSAIQHSANTLTDVDFVSQPKKHATETGKEVHAQFETILKFGHAHYDNKKISFREVQKKENTGRKKTNYRKGFQGQRRIRPKPTKVVQVPMQEFCTEHPEQRLYPTDRISPRLIIDLVVTKHGIRKTITRYWGVIGRCPQCHTDYIPPDQRKYYKNLLYGHGFKSWIVYQRVATRVTYQLLVETLQEQFHEELPAAAVLQFMEQFSVYYAETEELNIQHLLASPIIHADETPINTVTGTQYVWVFTDGRYVVFRLRPTREATIVHEFLESYNGILISDFYAGYDAVTCRQQKCWAHLIRDLNDELWHSPFDIEFERFILAVKDLIIPIMEAVQKYGLKKRHLHKFMKDVDKFYKTMVVEHTYKSELTTKYQTRFLRYRNSLFTFLEYDGIPWNNNAAERALRHLTKQLQISGHLAKSGVVPYLRLLGIRQTCRFQKKSFFRFLFSEKINIDDFK